MVAGFSRGDIAFNGFETGTGDWSFTQSGSPGDGNGSITQTLSGTGPLGLTAFDGSFYATLHGNTNGDGAGFANGGTSFFGFGAPGPAYPGSPFYQEISVYIDVNTAVPSNPGAAFWIDDSPSSSSPSDISNGGLGYGGEHNFQLTYTGSSVFVTGDSSASLASLAVSGWYTFRVTYEKSDGNPTDLSQAVLAVYDASGTQVGSTAIEVNNSNGDPLLNQDLQGPGYVWLPAWQNNFSNDLLGIDDVRAADTPEPASEAMIGAGLLLLAPFVWRRKSARRS